MAGEDLLKKLPNVPLAKPGFDALNMTAPILVQMNPNGKWENSKPGNLDEEKLKAVVQHLVNTKAMSAVQSYCCQCASEAKKDSGGSNSNYVPVIMIPIYSADQCPFDMDCGVKTITEAESQPKKSKDKAKIFYTETEAEKQKKKSKKKGFVMQRLTDFDLLSQW